MILGVGLRGVARFAGNISIPELDVLPLPELDVLSLPELELDPELEVVIALELELDVTVLDRSCVLLTVQRVVSGSTS